MSTVWVTQLMQMDRFDDAEKELRKDLAEDPENGMAHSLLGLCLSHRKRITEAHEAVEKAIGLEPENDFHFFAKAKVFMADQRYKEAETWLQKAIELDPEDSAYHAQVAVCRMQRDDAQGALEFTTRAVELDPENEDAVDIHVIVLNKLGRKEEAKAILEGSLHRNPHNAYAHANQGWAELHGNNPKKAVVHFEEALRLEPNNEYARSGLVEALKSGNPIYRLFLMYLLWLGRLSPSVRWCIILGGYAAFRLVDRACYTWPESAFFLKPLMGLYIAFAMLTWMADPFFNLLLFFHPKGRHALTEGEWRASLAASVLLFVAAAGGILYLCGFHAVTLLAAMFYAMLVPHVHTAMQVQNKRHKPIFLLYCALLGIAGSVGLVLVYQENAVGAQVLQYSFYAWLAYMFLGVFLRTES
jgi:tetratricopeptide (TPR) repeat protein